MLSALCEYDSVKNEMYLANFTHKDARHRIAFLVLELYRRLELKGLNNGFAMPFPLKQTDLGDMLGLSAVHVCRTLEVLREEGLLDIHQQTLSILDYTALSAMVGDYLEPINDCDLET